MTRPDPIRALRDTDPAARVDQIPSDDPAFTNLRDAILHSPRQEAQAPDNRHRRRRGLLAGGFSLLLVGGGAAAYAAHEQWVSTVDLTCVSTWTDPTSSAPSNATGGPPITDDPVADCQQYQQLAGRPPINDPVALDYGGGLIVVAPAAQVPADAPRADPPSARTEALTRLEHSLEDYVDGGKSRCFDSTAEAMAWARAETERVGLTNAPVAEQQLDPQTPQEGRCGWFLISDGTVLFSPRRGMDTSVPQRPDSPVYRLRDELRTQVAAKCLSLEDAQNATEELLTADDHWPTSAVSDESLNCTTVDLVVGGSIQVFLRGPGLARP